MLGRKRLRKHQMKRGQRFIAGMRKNRNFTPFSSAESFSKVGLSLTRKSKNILQAGICEETFLKPSHIYYPMKKEYSLFLLVTVFLFAMLFVSQADVSSPTGMAARALSTQAPLVIVMAFGVAGLFCYFAWKISKSE